MAATQTLLNPITGMSQLSPNIEEIRQIPIGRRTRTIGISSVWIFSVFGLLICTFMLYFHTVLLENQANHKQKSIIELRESNDALLAELAELSSLPMVDRHAKALGMESANTYRYINVSSKTVVSASQAQRIDVSSATYPIQPPVGF